MQQFDAAGGAHGGAREAHAPRLVRRDEGPGLRVGHGEEVLAFSLAAEGTSHHGQHRQDFVDMSEQEGEEEGEGRGAGTLSSSSWR